MNIFIYKLAGINKFPKLKDVVIICFEKHSHLVDWILILN